MSTGDIDTPGDAGRPDSPADADEGNSLAKPRSIAGLWLEGARLRTLPLAVAPVLIGTGAAAAIPAARLDVAGLCLLVALLLQIGVNYANDYSDGVRGTDDVRVGPPRLTASGRVDAKVVLRVAVAFFAGAAIAGLVLVAITGLWWMLVVGAAAIAAAWYYTGGKRPYGYRGFGEIVAFVFFGLVAVLGTTYLQAGTLTIAALLGAVAQGTFASAVLLINNVRDVDQDAAAGKRTLAVILGARAATTLYVVLLVVPYLLLAGVIWAVGLPAALAFGSVPLAAFAIVVARKPRTARDYITALQLTSIGSLAYAFMLALGLSMVPYI